ncbi:NB-ARC domain-containing protein [Candidatus Parabeggiatoa sp. HSG14]|uniref:NB-ARC domain-containing protein n=1 Tax=Candidatus Parabeggiatoa sp. HSG14 TaxID=3055593 RepID=UPI0025A8DA3A|nr:NB-ARC domain-containing protein [Thiotrichales bacterium HSG14]
MNLLILPDKKSLQQQFITDEAGNKTAVILPLNQFDELFDKIDSLAKMAESFEKTISELQKGKTSPVGSASEGSLEINIVLLKQHYDLLNKMLEDLRQYQNVKTELDRKLQLQRLVANLEAELQEVRFQLGDMKKQTKPATLHHVAELPNNLVKNIPLLNEIRSKLLVETTEEQRAPIILQAPCGMGKSVMATALARDTKIRQAYPDGIFWLSLGMEADLVAHQMVLLQALNDTTTNIAEVEKGTKRLRELCATRACLIILDDVTDAQDILAFNVVGEHCQLLITTSENNLLEIIQYFINTATAYEIAPFVEKQAIDFFLNYVNQNEGTATSINLDNIVSVCDYSPLTLRLMASVAQKHPSSKWGALVERLQSEDEEFPDKYPRALMQAMQLNVEELGEPADYYIALTVFAEYSRIPQSVALMLWRYLYQLIDEEALTFINELADKGLIEVYETSSKKYLSLHSFQYEYLSELADLEKLHTHLLAAYRRQCGQHGWISGPKDGYFFEYLCMHLHHANRHNELKLLLVDFDWIQNKLQATTVHSLLNDYEWLDSKEIAFIKKTLYDAQVVLLTNKEELANQLLDRLWDEKSLKNNKDIQALLNQAKETSPNWHWQPHFPDDKKRQDILANK